MPTVRRTTSKAGTVHCFTVESRHPTEGWLPRGTIRAVGVQDMTGAGVAGHLVWDLTTYDHVHLAPVTGDYADAERELLDATKELED